MSYHTRSRVKERREKLITRLAELAVRSEELTRDFVEELESFIRSVVDDETNDYDSRLTVLEGNDN